MRRVRSSAAERRGSRVSSAAMKTLSSSLVLSLSLAACGGAPDPAPVAPAPVAPTPAPAASAPAHAGHGDLPAPLAAFHDTLRPLWHDETADRQARTCAATGELEARAAALPGVEVADPQKAAYGAEVGKLNASLADLKAACAGSGDFAAAFTRVHDGFHALTGLAGAPHEHGAHEHGAHDHDH